MIRATREAIAGKARGMCNCHVLFFLGEYQWHINYLNNKILNPHTIITMAEFPNPKITFCFITEMGLFTIPMSGSQDHSYLCHLYFSFTNHHKKYTFNWKKKSLNLLGSILCDFRVNLYSFRSIKLLAKNQLGISITCWVSLIPMSCTNENYHYIFKILNNFVQITYEILLQKKY